MKGFVVFFILVAASLPRCECKNLGLQQAKTEEAKFADVDKYYTLDENKPLTDIKKFEDVSIEIDLLDSTHPKSEEQQEEEEKKPEQIVIYQIGQGEEDLPECGSKNQICSKIDLYGAPWIERLCRCPGGSACPSSLNASDGHTVEDRSKQYKFCEAVMRIPLCHYFKDVTWSLIPYGGPNNTTIQRVYCRCRAGAVPYLLGKDSVKAVAGGLAPVFNFGCSPQSHNVSTTEHPAPKNESGKIHAKPKVSPVTVSPVKVTTVKVTPENVCLLNVLLEMIMQIDPKMKCAHKEPCRLFTVRKRNKPNAAVEDVNVSTLCQCSKGFRCPKKHTDPGNMPSRIYPGLDIRTYGAYCTPAHHSNRSEVFKFRSKRSVKK